jgi:hypothetical protein
VLEEIAKGRGKKLNPNWKLIGLSLDESNKQTEEIYN